jgi:hypothetical protein
MTTPLIYYTRYSRPPFFPASVADKGLSTNPTYGEEAAV